MIGKDRQTVADLAVEHCGSAACMFALMRENNVSACANMSGKKFVVPAVAEPEIAHYFDEIALSPATDNEQDETDWLTNDADSIILTTIEGEYLEC